MTENGGKPTGAFVVSLLGGIFILLGGIVLALFGGIATLAIGGVGALIGAAGIATGIVVIVGAVLMYSKPSSSTAWGVVILVLSIVSWVTALGGFVIGFLLGLIGGILGIVYK